MKKNSIFVALASMLVVTFASCESKEPGSSEKTSLPATARAVLLSKPNEAKQILRSKGYYAPEWNDNMVDFVYIYPKECASEDEKTQEKALQGPWIELNCHTEGADIVQTVWGEHYLPTASDAFDTFNQWRSYLEKNTTDYDLHEVIITTDKGTFVYEEGKLFDDYKKSRIAFYEDGYSKGQITKEQLDELKKTFFVTKADLNQHLSSLSASIEYDHHEIYIQLKNASDFTGILSMSRFDNYPSSSEQYPNQRVLEHRLQYMNVEDMAGSLLAMIEN